MRFGSTAKVLLKCKLKYYRISECECSKLACPGVHIDEHHAIFECSGHATTRQMVSDLLPSHVSTVSQFLNQPDCNRLAKVLTWIRMLRLNTA